MILLDAIRLVSSCLNSKGVTSLEPSSSNTVKQLFTSGEKVNMGVLQSREIKKMAKNESKNSFFDRLAFHSNDCGRVVKIPAACQHHLVDDKDWRS